MHDCLRLLFVPEPLFFRENPSLATQILNKTINCCFCESFRPFRFPQLHRCPRTGRTKNQRQVPCQLQPHWQRTPHHL